MPQAQKKKSPLILSVVIPVYNEINTLLEILKRVEAVPIEKEIIIVDDGSTDGTRDLLRRLKRKNTKVFFNQKNRGKGFSIRRGFKHVSGQIVVIQDADLEYFPDEFPFLIKKILEGKADVVYGTRFLGSHRVFNFYHYLGNKLINSIANFLYNTNLSDFMTCYKAFRVDALRRLKLRADRFGIEAEITAQIFKKQLRVYEVPISYDGRGYDEGKKITWKDFFRSLYWLLKCRFEIDDVGHDTLQRMRLMKNNNRWTFDLLKPFLGESILEIGSGIGSFSRFLAVLNKKLVLTDINKGYLDYLKRRFISHPKIKVISHNITSKPTQKLLDLKIDTILAINVLEHIKADRQALKNIHQILVKKGRLILVVPALEVLYGSLDQELNHQRRYQKEEIQKRLVSQGFTIEKIFFHNLLASFGWFINSRLLNRKILSGIQASLLDKITPLLASLERNISIPFGLSLIVIARKK
jgi:glycosyltransferase involved in cell wall biosynthesis